MGPSPVTSQSILGRADHCNIVILIILEHTCRTFPKQTRGNSNTARQSPPSIPPLSTESAKAVSCSNAGHFYVPILFLLYQSK